MAIPSLTGRWVGYYSQHGSQHPLQAELTQEGTQVSGTMRDQDTTTDRSMFEAAAEAGLPPGADEQIIARLRQMMPSSTGSPIRARSVLPSDSMIQGTIKGQTVSFLKTYQGEHLSGYQVGNEFVGLRFDSHAVHYQGEVSTDGTVIAGSWWIDPLVRGERRTEGTFELRREAEEKGA